MSQVVKQDTTTHNISCNKLFHLQRFSRSGNLIGNFLKIKHRDFQRASRHMYGLNFKFYAAKIQRKNIISLGSRAALIGALKIGASFAINVGLPGSYKREIKFYLVPRSIKKYCALHDSRLYFYRKYWQGRDTAC